MKILIQYIELSERYLKQVRYTINLYRPERPYQQNKIIAGFSNSYNVTGLFVVVTFNKRVSGHIKTSHLPILPFLIIIKSVEPGEVPKS